MDAENHSKQVDVLAIGAHPDDVELCCGGTIARLVQLGYRVGLAEMTKGELGTRGTIEQRSLEASTAADILGVYERENLGMPDGDIQLTSENRLSLVRLIRKRRPRLIITHSKVGHPDHWQTHELVNQAVYHAGLAIFHTVESGQGNTCVMPTRHTDNMKHIGFANLGIRLILLVPKVVTIIRTTNKKYPVW